MKNASRTPAASLRQHSPAAERNRAPILARLQALLAPSGRALEIASGSGQHAACFAAALPGWHWQPSDASGALLASIDAWAAEAGPGRVAPARRLDVQDERWPSDGAPFAQPFDLIFCANLLHISAPECTAALLRGAARHLGADGLLVVYGPFLEDEVATAPSNLAFDADLRRRNPEWGIRRREDVEAQAHAVGLALRQRHALPANNLLLVWGRA